MQNTYCLDCNGQLSKERNFLLCLSCGEKFSHEYIKSIKELEDTNVLDILNQEQEELFSDYNFIPQPDQL